MASLGSLSLGARVTLGRPQTAALRASSSKPRAVATPFVVRAAQVAVKTAGGADKGTAELSLKTAGDNSTGLVHKYLVITQQNKRQGNASTLTKSEVRGGGRKPFKQKGTGNARAGSKRTPPKPKDWTIQMNKKERRLAMGTALQSAASATTVVEDLSGVFPAPKTATMYSTMAALGVQLADKQEHAVLVVDNLTEAIKKSGNNIPNLKVCTTGELSVYDVLRADKLVFDEASMAKINETFAA